MSSHGWPLLEIERDARGQRIVVTAALAATASAPFIAQLPLFIALASSLLGLACAALAFWRVGWLGGARTVLRASWTDARTWRLHARGGVQLAATLRPESRVVGKLIWLRFQSDGGQRQLLLWGGALRPDARRRLTARLRMYESAQAAEQAESGAAQ